MSAIPTLIVALTLAGPATVWDGDTIHVSGGERLRLAGIDAPEIDQVCLDGAGRSYSAGIKARDHLRELIAVRPVACVYEKRDVYGRSIVTCTAGEDATSLNARMVQDGWAFSA